MSDKAQLKEAERHYYALNRTIRSYSSALHPTVDPEWKALLRRKDEAQRTYNMLRERFRLDPIWP